MDIKQKINFFYISFIFLVVFGVNGCVKKRDFPEVKKISEFPNTKFITTLESNFNTTKNTVYCVTILNLWDAIKNKINKPLQIDSNYKHLILLNNSRNHQDALDLDEYNSKIGIEENKIIGFAKFSKSLPFENELNSYSNKLKFNNEKVDAFGVTGYSEQSKLKIVSILYYKNDENFIIKLQPKDEKHEIVLFKSDKKLKTMNDIIIQITKLISKGKIEKKLKKNFWKYNIINDDEILIPKISFNIEKNYDDLSGNLIKTNNNVFYIEAINQRTAFILDEKGAEIESVSEAVTEEENTKPISKKILFDKPFLIILKKTNSTNPYFGLWVANTELMIKN